MKVWEEKNKKFFVYNYKDNCYIHKLDIKIVNYELKPLSGKSNYYKIISDVNYDEMNLLSTYLLGWDSIELFFELNSISSIVVKNKIEFNTYSDPTGNRWLNTKIYNIFINYKFNKLEILFPQDELSLAIYIIFEKISNILIGTVFTQNDGYIVNKIVFNGKSIEIWQILDEIFINQVISNNKITIEFNNDIEKLSNLVLIIDDINDYEKDIKSFKQK